MSIALDATYSLDPDLSGVGVYSREILDGLAKTEPETRWDWFYRSHRYWRARSLPRPANVRPRLLAESFGIRSAQLFHGLNQRLPRRRFRRQVATFHDLFVFSGEYSTPEFRERFARQARDAASGADLLIAVSAFTAKQLENFLGIPASRIRIIHHGIVPRSAEPPPAGTREKMVLCVGSIQTRKNQATLVRAFRRLPKDWTLVLAGAQGFGAEEALGAIAKSPASSRIRVTGYVGDKELNCLYARASIFAFPSRDEGFGMPVLEAMACGVPVISSSRSALPEVCGNAAELIDPDQEEELALALMRLATDVRRRDELICLGHARTEQFRWNFAVQQTLGVYRELL